MARGCDTSGNFISLQIYEDRPIYGHQVSSLIFVFRKCIIEYHQANHSTAIIIDPNPQTAIITPIFNLAAAPVAASTALVLVGLGASPPLASVGASVAMAEGTLLGAALVAFRYVPFPGTGTGAFGSTAGATVVNPE